MQAIRKVFVNASGRVPIDLPEPIPVKDYGIVELTETVNLLDALQDLYPGSGIYSDNPERRENYNQSCVIPTPSVCRPVHACTPFVLTTSSAVFVLVVALP